MLRWLKKAILQRTEDSQEAFHNLTPLAVFIEVVIWFQSQWAREE
jgi:hypothetical protein